MAQETEDAELVALAAAVFREAAGMIAYATPGFPFDPAATESREYQALIASLKLRGVIPR